MRWTQVSLPFEDWQEGEQPVFRASQLQFTPDEIRQDNLATGSRRQDFFEGQLRRISVASGSSIIPVYIEFDERIRRRLDRGCIGHSLARGFVSALIANESGYVTHLELRE